MADTKDQVIELRWTGPHAWPRYEDKAGLTSAPRHPGVYLMTFEHKGGYLIYAAGVTRRPIGARLREHTRKYMSGDYTVLNASAAERGVRTEIWHGWGWTPQKDQEFAARRVEIQAGAEEQLARFRQFATDLGTVPRIHERLEAAIMGLLYEQPPPLCDVPDRGMHLAPRWESESPVTVVSSAPVALHGLPERFTI